MTQNDALLREQALQGLRRYQNAARQPRAQQRSIVAAHGRASLQSHAGLRPAESAGPPVLLIPSLINPPDVLDISPERSLLQALLRQGIDASLLDWGMPAEADRAEDLADHVTGLLLPLIEGLGRPPILVGYCLGGTLATAAAAVMTARGAGPAGLCTIATPWQFSAYDADFRTQIADIWEKSRAACETLGQVPMEVLQTGFWSLDSARTIRKYADFGRIDESAPSYQGFITLEDWANEGAPLTYAAGRDLIETLYGADMTGRGEWTVAGVKVDPADLPCPTLAIASTTDRIVPAEAAPRADEGRNLALGHVGMIVGGRAEDALQKPLANWIKQIGG